MWHNFILHTKAYCNFCLKHFRKLIHHYPTPKKEKLRQEKAFLKNPHQSLNEHKDKLEKQYDVIYEYLGPDTLNRWYDSFATKYTPEYIASIKKN